MRDTQQEGGRGARGGGGEHGGGAGPRSAPGAAARCTRLASGSEGPEREEGHVEQQGPHRRQVGDNDGLGSDPRPVSGSRARMADPPVFGGSDPTVPWPFGWDSPGHGAHGPAMVSPHAQPLGPQQHSLYMTPEGSKHLSGDHGAKPFSLRSHARKWHGCHLYPSLQTRPQMLFRPPRCPAGHCWPPIVPVWGQMHLHWTSSELWGDSRHRGRVPARRSTRSSRPGRGPRDCSRPLPTPKLSKERLLQEGHGVLKAGCPGGKRESEKAVIPLQGVGVGATPGCAPLSSGLGGRHLPPIPSPASWVGLGGGAGC